VVLWVLTVCCYVQVYFTILSHSMLSALRVQISLQTKNFRRGCKNLKKQGGFLLAPCAKKWSHEPPSANSGERREGNLDMFLTSGDLLAVCLHHITAVECLPERKLGNTRNLVDAVQKRHTAPNSNQHTCFPGHPPQNTVTCYNLYLTKNFNPSVSHLLISIIVHCKDI
jgi:hypothetical protein